MNIFFHFLKLIIFTLNYMETGGGFLIKDNKLCKIYI